MTDPSSVAELIRNDVKYNVLDSREKRWHRIQYKAGRFERTGYVRWKTRSFFSDYLICTVATSLGILRNKFLSKEKSVRTVWTYLLLLLEQYREDLRFVFNSQKNSAWEMNLARSVVRTNANHCVATDNGVSYSGVDNYVDLRCHAPARCNDDALFKE